MYLKALAISFGVALLAQDLGAQTRQSSATVPIAAGSRVRVMTPTLVAPLVANFLEQRGDTLVFIEDGRGRGVWSFAVGQITRLETTAGEAGRNRKPIARSAAIGAGIGLIAGVAFAAAFEPADSTREYSKVLSGALGAGIGAGIGGYVGSRVKTERWVEVPLPRRVGLRTNGRGIALTFRFR